MDGYNDENGSTSPKQGPTEKNCIEAHSEDKEIMTTPTENKLTKLEPNTQTEDTDLTAIQEQEAKVLEHKRKHQRRHCACS